MKSKLLVDFDVYRENNTICIQREFDAPLALIWQAWTTAELLDCWCAPRPYRVETKTMDFRQGGFWHYALVSPKGDRHWSRYDYQKIDLRKSITELRGFSDENGAVNPDYPRTECVITFSEAAGKTLIRIDEKYRSSELFEKMATDRHKKGFSSHLGNLDKLLLTLKDKK